MWIKLFIAVVAIVIENLVFIALRFLFPYKENLLNNLSSQSKDELEDEFSMNCKYNIENIGKDVNILREEYYKKALKEKYKKLNILSFFLLIGCIGLIFPTTYYLYSFMKEAVITHFNSFSGYVYMIRPSSEYVTIPSVLIASFVAIASPFLVLKLLLLGKFKEYFNYQSWESGLNAGKIFLLIGSTITIFFLSVIILGANCYTLIQKDEIKIDRFYSISTKNYSYNDIEAIYKVKKYRAPNGNILEKPYYMVKFSDGYIWTPRDYVVEWEPQDKEAEIFNYISTTSKKEIQEIELRENL